MTVKRRVIWLSDDDWRDLTSQAADQMLSVSQLIAHKFLAPSTMRPANVPIVGIRPPEYRPVPKPSHRK